MNVLVDYHHDSLLTSLYTLFEGRLGHTLYRPAGMRWFREGFWKINDQQDTAQQFLAETPPKDGTRTIHNNDHRTITFDEFLDTDFDLIIASVPQHIEPFKQLAASKHAKFVVQVGNNWPPDFLAGYNVLASVQPGSLPLSNTCYYRQEFDTNIFHPVGERYQPHISSYINCLSEFPVGWADFRRLQAGLWVPMVSYGGQCKDGNLEGPHRLAKSMQRSSMVFHVKDGGDGYGHIAHNALACGKPLIVRGRFTQGTLIGGLLNRSNSIDLDEYDEDEGVERVKAALDDPYMVSSMSVHAYQAFTRNVDFGADAMRVSEWLGAL